MLAASLIGITSCEEVEVPGEITIPDAESKAFFQNGKSILFVDSGYCINTTCYGRGGYAGYCWSSSLVESDIANDHEWAPSEAWVGYIYGPNKDLGVFNRERIYGLNIRPVMD